MKEEKMVTRTSMTEKTGRQNAVLACRRVGLLCVAGAIASVLAATVIEKWDEGLTNKDVSDVAHWF